LALADCLQPNMTLLVKTNDTSNHQPALANEERGNYEQLGGRLTSHEQVSSDLLVPPVLGQKNDARRHRNLEEKMVLPTSPPPLRETGNHKRDP
jgi:hypothetical protein